MTGIFLKRGNSDPETDAHREKAEIGVSAKRCQQTASIQGRARAQRSTGTDPAVTLDFQPPELAGTTSLLFKPLGWRNFATAAPAHQDTRLSSSSGRIKK